MSAMANALTEALQDKKMLDKYDNEDPTTIRLHKQRDCFFCSSPWYLSDRKLLFHQKKKVEDPSWRFPTSCPDCRVKSKLEALQARLSGCRTGKREFASAQDAEFFSKEVVEKNGIPPQHSYQCPDCKMFHLTSKEPVTTMSSGTLASPLAKVVQMEKPAEKRKAGESRTEVARLLGLGHSTAEIASRLNMTQTNVWYHKKRIEGAPVPTKPAVLDVEALDASDLDATAERLRLQLEEIQRKKVRLAEAKMLRVELVNGAIKIVKEGEHMLLPFEERDKLVLLLSQITVAATEPQKEGQYGQRLSS